MTKQAESPDKEYCTRCDGEITADELAKGWPIPLDDDDYTCPSCYGDEAFCAEGHVLSGTTDSDLCAECTTDATQTAIGAATRCTRTVTRNTTGTASSAADTKEKAP